MIFLPKLCIIWQVGAVFAKRTASAGRLRSRIELRELKRRDCDYAKVTRIMHLHNDYAKFMQEDYAKFRQIVVPLPQLLRAGSGVRGWEGGRERERESERERGGWRESNPRRPIHTQHTKLSSLLFQERFDEANLPA